MSTVLYSILLPTTACSFNGFRLYQSLVFAVTARREKLLHGGDAHKKSILGRSLYPSHSSMSACIVGLYSSNISSEITFILCFFRILPTDCVPENNSSAVRVILFYYNKMSRPDDPVPLLATEIPPPGVVTPEYERTGLIQMSNDQIESLRLPSLRRLWELTRLNPADQPIGNRTTRETYLRALIALRDQIITQSPPIDEVVQRLEESRERMRMNREDIRIPRPRIQPIDETPQRIQPPDNLSFLEDYWSTEQPQPTQPNDPLAFLDEYWSTEGTGFRLKNHARKIYYRRFC
jgi:hypothetical protein